MFITKNPTFHDFRKHVEVDCYFIHESLAWSHLYIVNFNFGAISRYFHQRSFDKVLSFTIWQIGHDRHKVECEEMCAYLSFVSWCWMLFLCIPYRANSSGH